MTRRMYLGPDVRHQIEAVLPYVDDIVLYINSACNLRCKHCYIGNSLLNENNAFATDDLCSFIEQFEKLSRITILGGEPLMHRGINKILQSALRVPIADRRLTTNLTSFFFLDRAKLKGADVTFAVSLDGHNAELHDFVRGKGSFDRTASNLRMLVAEGFDVEISHTVTTRNINSFENLTQRCKDFGIKKLNLHKMSLQGNALDNAELLVPPWRWIDFCDQLALSSLLAPSPQHSLRVRYPPTYVNMEEFQRMVRAGEYWGHRQRSYYSEGEGRRIVLYPNGRVYISSELFGTDSHIGTISNGRFELHDSPNSELSAGNQADDPLLLARLGSAVASDKEHPALLSVSFKRLVYL
jgi:MoaA/NifB/PqqE/SkfB family radical SAM enzyme